MTSDLPSEPFNTGLTFETNAHKLVNYEDFVLIQNAS